MVFDSLGLFEMVAICGNREECLPCPVLLGTTGDTVAILSCHKEVNVTISVQGREFDVTAWFKS